MKKRTLVMAAVFLGILAACAVAAPIISVDSSTYDFGSALEGSIVTHRFVIRNLGDQPLSNLRARSTCGCTTSSLPSTTLAPGASLEIEVAFDTRGYGGQTVTKTLYVESNDPKNPRLTLRLQGQVVRMAAHNIAVTDLENLIYILIDLRSPEAYTQSHILGAVNIPYEQFAAMVPLLPSGNLIIVYDEDGTRGDEIAKMLIQAGRRDAKSLMGGFAMWVRQMGTGFLWPLGQ
jgi:rhodanese-related sulfurtransferase